MVCFGERQSINCFIYQMQTSLESCATMFARMQADGWNTNQRMLWGFFFCDADKSRLLNVFSELKDSGYKLENIYQLENDEESWMLHVSKIDLLTPEKLHKRNAAFNELADYCGVAAYDGWDVSQLES